MGLAQQYVQKVSQVPPSDGAKIFSDYNQSLIWTPLVLFFNLYYLHLWLVQIWIWIGVIVIVSNSTDTAVVFSILQHYYFTSTVEDYL